MILSGRTIKGTAATFNLYLTERHQNTLLACWIVLSCLILVIDYSTGSVIQFPFMFIVTVGLAACITGRELDILEGALPEKYASARGVLPQRR